MRRRRAKVLAVPAPLHMADSADCLVWQGFVRPCGYAYTNDPFRKLASGKRRTIGAHQLAWLRANDMRELPEGSCVCHRCDVRTCLEPTHLFLGTKAINNADMCAKGRHRAAPGERNGSAKLTPEIVQAIRGSVGTDATVARRHGISRQHAGKIRNGTRWGHL